MMGLIWLDKRFIPTSHKLNEKLDSPEKHDKMVALRATNKGLEQWTLN
jgi:hypothetical protein